MLEPIPNLALDAKIDPFRVPVRSGLPVVPVGTAGRPGRIGAGMGGFGAGLEIWNWFLELLVAELGCCATDFWCYIFLRTPKA